MILELKQECAEGKITVDDMLQRIEAFENRKKLVKNKKWKLNLPYVWQICGKYIQDYKNMIKCLRIEKTKNAFCFS